MGQIGLLTDAALALQAVGAGAAPHLIRYDYGRRQGEPVLGDLLAGLEAGPGTAGTAGTAGTGGTGARTGRA